MRAAVQSNHMGNYSPKIDLVFRKLFGSEENKDLLIALINGILESKPHLTDLTIKNPYNLASYIGSKESILDIKAVDQDGVWYDIEMQIGELRYYGKRALYYLSKVYVDQLEEGAGFDTLRKTIGIHLVDFDLFDDLRYRRRFVYKDMETNEYIENLSYQQLYFIETSKFRKDWTELATPLDRWIAFLNKAQTLTKGTMPQQLLAEPGITRAVEKLQTMAYEPLEREIYEGELKAYLTRKEELRTAKEKLQNAMEAGLIEGRNEGHKAGREEGLEEGREEGLKVGRAEGRAEARAELMSEALERLLGSGISDADAKKILGIE